MSYVRPDGRTPTALRPITINVGVSKFAEGSAEISFGDTKVLCLATLQESVPKFLEGKGTGWITAEYAMLPRSTPERSQRESIAGRPGGRTFEIQRLVGRALTCGDFQNLSFFIAELAQFGLSELLPPLLFHFRKSLLQLLDLLLYPFGF